MHGTARCLALVSAGTPGESRERWQVWGPPTSVLGRVVQLGVLSTLVGAVPLALAGYVLLQVHRGRSSRGWIGVARTGALLQAGGVLSSLLLGGLFLSEMDASEILGELVGPIGMTLGFVCVNLMSAVFGLRAWLALGRANTETARHASIPARRREL